MNYRPLTHSKVYRYPLGHEKFRACTIGELREFLAQFHPETPVVVEWEGVARSLTYPALFADFFGMGAALMLSAEHAATEHNATEAGEVTFIPSENGQEDGQVMPK